MRQKMLLSVRVLLVPTCVMMLTACATTPTTATGDATRVACEAFEPITFSGAGDTAETVRQVREHNAAWDELCGKIDP